MNKQTEGQSQGLEGQQMEVPAVWRLEDNVPTLYANQLLVSHTGSNEFYLVFGETQFPFPIDPENPPTHVDIRPLVKIVVVPEVMQNMMKILNANVSRFVAVQRRVDNESTE